VSERKEEKNNSSAAQLLGDLGGGKTPVVGEKDIFAAEMGFPLS